MESKTVTVGDTTVEVSETEHGYSVQKVNNSSGTHIRFESTDSHGCQIPIDSDFEYKPKYEGSHKSLDVVFFHTDDDVSSLMNNTILAEESDEYDGAAYIRQENTEIIHESN